MANSNPNAHWCRKCQVRNFKSMKDYFVNVLPFILDKTFKLIICLFFGFINFYDEKSASSQDLIPENITISNYKVLTVK